MYQKYFKKSADITIALLLTPFVLIFIIFISIVIKLEDGGPIIYKAKRRGKNGAIFHIYKIRTMRVNAPDIRNSDGSTFNSKDDERVTKVGKILRKTSLDELPQIFNVLKGEMSFIGPRPITIDKPLSEYDVKRKERLKVLPGITGYSQAYFRNSISQEEKFEFDAKYANNINLLSDIKIIIETIKTVFLSKGIHKNTEKR